MNNNIISKYHIISSKNKIHASLAVCEETGKYYISCKDWTWSMIILLRLNFREMYLIPLVVSNTHEIRSISSTK